MNTFERDIVRIHQIELSSECNLRCKYCAHPKMQREKAHMSMDTFKRTMAHVIYYADKDIQLQPELSLTGVGEALLNPEFMSMVRYARSVYKGAIIFSTNGLLLTEEVVKELAKLKVYVYISLHRPEVAKKAIDIAKQYQILIDVNYQFATSSFNWAGQVDWEVTAPKIKCAYLTEGWSAVLQDGTVTTCCMDAEGINTIGHVDDQIGSLTTTVKGLCKTCHMVVPTISLEGVA